MKRLVFSIIVFLFSCGTFSQTVVSRSHRIKNTQIEWSISGNDTIYILPVVDFTSPLGDMLILRFRGINALISTLSYLSKAEISEGEMVRLDFTIDKNIVSRSAKMFSSGYLVFNKEYELPTSVFWRKNSVKDEYKRLMKYVTNGKYEEKPKSKSNDDMYN